FIVGDEEEFVVLWNELVVFVVDGDLDRLILHGPDAFRGIVSAVGKIAEGGEGVVGRKGEGHVSEFFGVGFVDDLGGFPAAGEGEQRGCCGGLCGGGGEVAGELGGAEFGGANAADVVKAFVT